MKRLLKLFAFFLLMSLILCEPSFAFRMYTSSPIDLAEPGPIGGSTPDDATFIDITNNVNLGAERVTNGASWSRGSFDAGSTLYLVKSSGGTTAATYDTGEAAYQRSLVTITAVDVSGGTIQVNCGAATCRTIPVAAGTNVYTCYITESDTTNLTVNPTDASRVVSLTISVKTVSEGIITNYGRTFVRGSMVFSPAVDVSALTSVQHPFEFYDNTNVRQAYINQYGQIGGRKIVSSEYCDTYGYSWLLAYGTATAGTKCQFGLSMLADTQTSGTPTFYQFKSTYNQSSGTAANSDMKVWRVETAIGSGTQRLVSAGTGSTYAEKFGIDNKGAVSSTMVNNADSDTDEVDSVTWAGGYGVLTACSTTDGTSAMWKLEGTALTAISVDADWTATKDNGSTYNVYFESGAVKLQNKVGDNKAVKLGFFGIL